METPPTARSITEVANRLVEHCRTGRFDLAQQELYADHARSYEPEHTGQPVAEGRQAIAEKGRKWSEGIETYHGGEITEPLMAGNFFTVIMRMDTTTKGGERNQMDEICVYEVQNGKIVQERFFY